MHTVLSFPVLLSNAFFAGVKQKAGAKPGAGKKLVWSDGCPICIPNV